MLGEFQMTNHTLIVMLYSIVGLMAILAVYFYLKQAGQKRMGYFMKTYSIINGSLNKFESLKVSYSGEAVENNLFVTRIAMWNKCKRTIQYGDVEPTEPIRISIAEGYKIMEAKCQYVSNPDDELDIVLSSDQSSAQLEFKHLDTGGEFVIELLHSGEQDVLEIDGVIKGSKKALQPLYFDNADSVLIKANLLFILPFFCATTVYTMWMISQPDSEWLRTLLIHATFWGFLGVFFFICILTFLVCLLVYRTHRGKYPPALLAQLKIG